MTGDCVRLSEGNNRADHTAGLSAFGRSTYACVTFFHKPQITELNEIAMTLKAQNARRSLRLTGRATCRSRNFNVVVDEYAIEPGGKTCASNLLTRCVQRGTGEVDVIGLPQQWWQTHVHFGCEALVNAPTFVVFAVQAKRVED